MARVLIPQNARIYNQNPKGSATAVVTMRAENPFEGGRSSLVRNRANIPTVATLAGVGRSSAMPGMGGVARTSGALPGMGEDAAAPASTGFDFSSLLNTGIQAITSVGTNLVNNRVATLYGPSTQAVTTPQMQSASSPTINVMSPTGATSQQPIIIQAPAAKTNWLPIALIGGGAAVLAIIFLMKKK